MKTWVYAWTKNGAKEVMYKGEKYKMDSQSFSFAIKDSVNPLKEMENYIDINEFSKIEIKILNES